MLARAWAPSCCAAPSSKCSPSCRTRPNRPCTATSVTSSASCTTSCETITAQLAASGSARVGVKKSKIHVLEALLRLRQAACHPGLIDKKAVEIQPPSSTVLLEQLRRGRSPKAIRPWCSRSSPACWRSSAGGSTDAGLVYEYLDGKTVQRQAKVERFQTDPACPLFLISLKAGGHGLNLTAADYVFILDPWWNPAVEAQAIDRAHRLGQQRHVFAYRLIARDTVEEKIVQLQQHKRDLADAIVSADNSLLRALTVEESATTLELKPANLARSFRCFSLATFNASFAYS